MDQINRSHVVLILKRQAPGSGYWGFLIDLPIQLALHNPGKAPGKPVAG